MPSFILIHPTVWPQYTNVTDRQDRTDRQRSDRIGRTVLQTVAKKIKDLTDRHPFNGLFSRTTSVSRCQKGYTNLDFNEARDDGVAVASAEQYANYLHLAPER